jgi:hypothetical protein
MLASQSVSDARFGFVANATPNSDLPDVNLKATVGTGQDLYLKLQRIFLSGQLESLTNEQLLTALYVLQNYPSSPQQMLIQAMTINHVRTSRFLGDLDKKNTRLTWLVIILATLAVLVGIVQSVAAIIQTYVALHH